MARSNQNKPKTAVVEEKAKTVASPSANLTPPPPLPQGEGEKVVPMAGVSLPVVPAMLPVNREPSARRFVPYQETLHAFPGFHVECVASYRVDEVDAQAPYRVRLKKGSGYLLNEDSCSVDGNGFLLFRGFYLYVESEENYRIREHARTMRHINALSNLVDNTRQAVHGHVTGDLKGRDYEVDGNVELTQRPISQAMTLDPVSYAAMAGAGTEGRADSEVRAPYQNPAVMEMAQAIAMNMLSMYGVDVQCGSFPTLPVDGQPGVVVDTTPVIHETNAVADSEESQGTAQGVRAPYSAPVTAPQRPLAAAPMGPVANG